MSESNNFAHEPPDRDCLLTGQSGSDSSDVQFAGVRVSIGMCAWNEERRIARTIQSLLRQDVFHQECHRFARIEIVILVNGSTDDTAKVARETLERGRAELPAADRVVIRVEETAEGGLARAINSVTHDLSDPDADYLFKLDCDVEFAESDVLRKLVAALESDPRAEIARPRCLKHLEAQETLTLVDRLSLYATRIQGESVWYVSLSGALYCGRAKTLRTIWEPIGMRGTDVHVRDMVVTENWRYPNDRRDYRIIMVDDATVYFDAYVGLSAILYHRNRAVVGNVSRAILHDFFREQVGEEDASQLIRRKNDEDPDWYSRLIQSRLHHGRWWVLPRPLFTWSRVRSLKAASWVKRLVRFPLILLLEAADAYAALNANRLFKRQAELSVWRPGAGART